MSRPRVKVKAKKGKGKSKPAKVKTKMGVKGYIGDDPERLWRMVQQERSRSDSLQKQIDSLKCEIKIKIEQQ